MPLNDFVHEEWETFDDNIVSHRIEFMCYQTYLHSGSLGGRDSALVWITDKHQLRAQCAVLDGEVEYNHAALFRGHFANHALGYDLFS